MDEEEEEFVEMVSERLTARRKESLKGIVVVGGFVCMLLESYRAN